MIHVEKWHGTGNDFVVVNADERIPDRRAFARRLCDRRTGISSAGVLADENGRAVEADGGTVCAGDGDVNDRVEADEWVGADGVLYLALEDKYRPPRVIMTLVQPDGSTAPMCGNGARVAAAWAAERTEADRVMVDTQAGTRAAVIERDGGEVTSVTIEMGKPTFDPEGVPLNREEPLIDELVAGQRVTAVNTGVPHAVSFVSDVEALDVDAVAPPIRHDSVFPKGANVSFASEKSHAADSGTVDGFDQRTFERGVEGETCSCGTGAVAIAVAAHRLGLAGREVVVSPPGGDLLVELPPEDATSPGDQVLLSGPVERSYELDVQAPPVPETAP